MAKGWECPRCGDVYGPSVTKCTNPDCKKTPRTRQAPAHDEDEDESGGLGEVSGDDIHDMLYRETVVFPSGKPRGRSGRGSGGGHGSSDGSSGVF